MMRRPHHPIAAAVAALTLASAGVARQQQPNEREVLLMRGWLAEQLHCDVDAAKTIYEGLAGDEATPAPQRAVALARLIEIDHVVGSGAWRRHGRDLNEIVRVRRISNGAIPRAQVVSALAMPTGPERDAALQKAREALHQTLESPRSRRYRSRSVVPPVLDRLRAEEVERRSRLEAELAAAEAANDRARARRLRNEIRETASSLRSSLRVGEIVSTGRTLILERLEQGKNAEVDDLRSRFSGERPERNWTTEALRGLPARLKRVSGVPDDERAALDRLIQKIEILVEAQKWKEAEEIAKRLPPYRVLR